METRKFKILKGFDFRTFDELESFDMFPEVRPFLVMFCFMTGRKHNSEEGNVLRFMADDNWATVPFNKLDIVGYHYDYKEFVRMFKNRLEEGI